MKNKNIKYCPKCDTNKDKSEFHNNKTRHDDLAGICAFCANENRDRNYKKNHKRELGRFRNYRAKRKELAMMNEGVFGDFKVHEEGVSVKDAEMTIFKGGKLSFNRSAVLEFALHKYKFATLYFNDNTGEVGVWFNNVSCPSNIRLQVVLKDRYVHRLETTSSRFVAHNELHLEDGSNTMVISDHSSDGSGVQLIFRRKLAGK